MTIAICTACGITKLGALTECPECGYQPPEDDKLSFWLCEWYADQKTMDTIGGYIQKLRKSHHDPEAIRAMVLEEFSE